MPWTGVAPVSDYEFLAWNERFATSIPPTQPGIHFLIWRQARRLSYAGSHYDGSDSPGSGFPFHRFAESIILIA
jgi:hypothetical protein